MIVTICDLCGGKKRIVHAGYVLQLRAPEVATPSYEHTSEGSIDLCDFCRKFALEMPLLALLRKAYSER
jgi:hypothetical protein